jgi:beta-mannanase
MVIGDSSRNGRLAGRLGSKIVKTFSVFCGLTAAYCVSPASAQDAVRFGVYDPHGTFSSASTINIEHIYVPWLDLDLGSISAASEYALARGRALVITIEPWSWSARSSTDPDTLHKDILSGQFDQTISSICSLASQLKTDTTIRWAHEMDLQNKRFPWSRWSPQQYVETYRYFVTRCRQASLRLKFMWSPRGEPNMQSYYPGDSYVDYVGLSIFGYQDFEKGVLGKELTLSERLSQPYRLGVTFKKPIYIAEFGCFGDTRFKARCIAEMKSGVKQYPGVVSVLYFNETETFPWPKGYGYPDWRDLNKLFGK